MRKTEGFTLTEVLVAVAVIGILLVAVVGPLGDLYSWLGRSSRELDGTTQVQRMIESVRAAWSTQTGYDAAAAPSDVPPTALTCVALDYSAEPLTPGSCADSNAPLKRVSLQVGETSLTLDIARP